MAPYGMFHHPGGAGVSYFTITPKKPASIFAILRPFVAPSIHSHQGPYVRLLWGKCGKAYNHIKDLTTVYNHNILIWGNKRGWR